MHAQVLFYSLSGKRQQKNIQRPLVGDYSKD